MKLIDATSINPINRIDDKTGASVGMWRGIYALPMSFREYLVTSAPSACLHAGCHPGRCVYGRETAR